jgi:hypothetical protein
MAAPAIEPEGPYEPTGELFEARAAKQPEPKNPFVALPGAPSWMVTGDPPVRFGERAMA